MKVVISGTSSGIGKATALLFLEKGYLVYGIDRNKSAIDNPNYTHYMKDIRDSNLPEVKDVDVIVANAGVQDENDAISINLMGTINFINKYQDSNNLKSILLIASSSARNGAEFPLYSTSKGGVVSYMKNLALNMAKRKVTVNSISPGGVITPLNKHILENEELYSQVLNETLLKKWAEAREIAEWIYFLTVINKSMTGEDLLIDNGEILKSNFIW